jgi:hypothetical protein
VLFSLKAREAAKFIAVVVLPTPPFWLAIQITLAIFPCNLIIAGVKDK